MNNSNDGTPTKCFSGFLTRVLCRGSLPTHPSGSDHNDHTPEQEQPTTTRFIDLLKQEPSNQKQPTAPGIVARLMGLETLPDLEWVPKSRLSDSYSRSRSVNSMDCLVQFDHAPLRDRHRRVKTSVSFREVPAGINQQSQECFVFYLDNVDRERRDFLPGEERTEFEKKKTEQNREKMVVRKTEQHREKVVVKKQSKTGRSLKGNDEPRRVSSTRNCSKVGDCRKTSAISKAKSPLKISQQKKKKNQLVVKEAKSEGEYKKKSSPVSVMDIKKTSIRHERSFSEVSNKVELKSRKKHPKKKANVEYPSPQISLKSNNDGFKKRAIEKKEMKINGETEYYVRLLGEIYRLTETECKEELPYWVGENNKVLKKSDDFEEVCVEFGQQILDQLLHHLIYELSGDHML